MGKGGWGEKLIRWGDDRENNLLGKRIMEDEEEGGEINYRCGSTWIYAVRVAGPAVRVDYGEVQHAHAYIIISSQLSKHICISVDLLITY